MLEVRFLTFNNVFLNLRFGNLSWTRKGRIQWLTGSGIAEKEGMGHIHFRTRLVERLYSDKFSFPQDPDHPFILPFLVQRQNIPEHPWILSFLVQRQNIADYPCILPFLVQRKKHPWILSFLVQRQNILSILESFLSWFKDKTSYISLNPSFPGSKKKHPAYPWIRPFLVQRKKILYILENTTNTGRQRSNY